MCVDRALINVVFKYLNYFVLFMNDFIKLPRMIINIFAK